MASTERSGIGFWTAIAVSVAVAVIALAGGCTQSSGDKWVAIGTFNYRKVPPGDIDALLRKRNIESQVHGSVVYQIEVLEKHVAEAKELLRGASFASQLHIYP